MAFLKSSRIKFIKLFLHTIFLTIILSFLSNICTDIIALILGHPIERDTEYVVTFMVLIWLFFALQSEKYRVR
ncbi:hypothetical protein DMO16_01395 [Fictibacillus sp. S7]|uniref:Uncharacterized protein n=1 Tax=Fictibacillus enclensis TaxID=1017270 RepID=A0A0V8JFN6_9BACL|nr:hypothetical protein AS030_10285 [Fictibacillus enclensis]RXY98430.1 hypothetical protein DMO16_01395 [Fictibacillus sp. S7]